MDLKTYFQLFWVPAIASAALLTLVWILDGVSRREMLLLASWFVGALIAQSVGTRASVVWVAGLVLQTALAIVLIVKAQVAPF